MCMFGGGAAASAPPPPPPPELPEKPPEPAKQIDEGTKKARADAQTRARNAQGMASTDTTKGALVGSFLGAPKTATGQ